MNDAVAIRGLSFDYGDRGFELVIDELRIPAGERLVLIGPSGSGKTTLLQLAAGILVAARGSLEVLGRSLPALDDTARRAFRITSVGLVFQEFELLEHLTVRENILLPYYVNSTLALDSTTEESLVRLATRTGIQDFLARRPRNLSQGERQRVAICRALITRPALILADEPTGNLDPETRETVLDLIDEEVRARDCTLLAVTHDHSILERFDRVIDFGDFREGGES